MNKIEKLKSLITEYVTKFGKVEMTFKDVKLTDGVTVVRFPNEMIMAGDAVTVITEQGELPLPNNTPENPIYTLEDGSTFTVLNGLVDMYTEAETEAEDTAEVGVEEMPATPATPVAPKMEEKAPKRVIKSQVEEHVFNEFKKTTEDTIVSLKEQIEILSNTNKTLVEKFDAQFAMQKEIVETINAIADEPATTSVENFKKHKAEEKRELTAFEIWKAHQKKVGNV